MPARDDVLCVRWSRARADGQHFGAQGDLVFAWGAHCAAADAALLHDVLSGERPRLVTLLVRGETPVFDPSLLEELDRRGYDLTTLRLTIRKKTPQDAG